MITWDKVTLLDAVERCLLAYVPDRIAARVTADSAGLLDGLTFPDPVTFAGRHDDFAHDVQTPALFIDLLDDAFDDVNASELQTAQTTLSVSLLIAESDVNADTARDFLRAAAVYSDAIGWVLSSKLPVFECQQTGVHECYLRRSPMSPEFQPEGEPRFLRVVVVEASVSRRVQIDGGA